MGLWGEIWRRTIEKEMTEVGEMWNELKLLVKVKPECRKFVFANALQGAESNEKCS